MNSKQVVKLMLAGHKLSAFDHDGIFEGIFDDGTKVSAKVIYSLLWSDKIERQPDNTYEVREWHPLRHDWLKDRNGFNPRRRVTRDLTMVGKKGNQHDSTPRTLRNDSELDQPIRTSRSAALHC